MTSGASRSTALIRQGPGDGEHQPRCRFCSRNLEHTFIDLGTAPPCQSQVAPSVAHHGEMFFPLHARVCTNCFLVQIDDVVDPADIFHTGDYAYFSSYSDSWVRHAALYVELIVERAGLGPDHFVVEIASNDGYLLQYFVERGIRSLGVDPAANCAAAARERGVETIVEFFGVSVAERLRSERGPADLIVGNNVLAHVPDINDLVGGLRVLLTPGGTITMEFPHLVNLVEQNQFDTIYHEHYSYLGFCTVETIFAHHGLTIYDVEELPTHGGSLRIYARHTDATGPIGERVERLRQRELNLGVRDLAWYDAFRDRVEETRYRLLEFLVQAKREGKRVAGYGAPGKGNTLLNYCAIRRDLLEYTVDRSPHKQGHLTPGTRIPVFAPERILETRPDYVLILPWNLKEEIMQQMRAIGEWGGRFVVAIPRVEVLEAPSS